MHALCEHVDVDDCCCGINAFASEQHLIDDGHYRQESVWGEVRQFRDGWRGEVAHPTRLFVQSHEDDETPAAQIAAGLALTYGIPVEVKNLPAPPAPPLEEEASQSTAPLPPSQTPTRPLLHHVGTVLHHTLWLVSAAVIAASWVLGRAWLESVAAGNDLTQFDDPLRGGPNLLVMVAPILVVFVCGITTGGLKRPDPRITLRAGKRVKTVTLDVNAYLGMLFAVAVVSLFAHIIVLSYSDDAHKISPDQVAERVAKTGNPVTIKSEPGHSLAWASAYRSFDNGDCKMIETGSKRVTACRTDDKVRFDLYKKPG